MTYDVSKAGTYGTLYVKSSDGSYVFVPNATAINARKTSTSETFTVTATDANASPATGTATLTVNLPHGCQRRSDRFGAFCCNGQPIGWGQRHRGCALVHRCGYG